MRRLCQHSRRWHQQFYQSIQRSGHRECIIQLVAIRQYRQRSRSHTVEAQPNPESYLKTRVEDLKVREFEQIGPSNKDVVEVNPEAEGKEATKDLKDEIDRLEQELAILREGPFGPNSEFMRSLSPDDRAKALKALEDEGLGEEDSEDLANEEELDRLVEEAEAEAEAKTSKDATAVQRTPGVTLRIPAQQKAYVKQFNKSLAAIAEDDLDQERHITLWKWYLRCQQHVPGFSNLVPEDVWQTLWHSQYSFASHSKRFVMLAKDMLSIQMPLSSEQWVTYIEALLLDGDAGSAVALWEEKRKELGPDSSVAAAFWSLGVRIYCDLGRPGKAQRIALDCLDHGSFAEPQILVPVIVAWAGSQDPEVQRKAWVCYLRLRKELGNGMAAADFEQVSTALLKAGKVDLALAVFKDMLLFEESSANDSVAVYEKALDHIKDLQSSAVSEENINRVSLAALLILPKSFQNKFFYGSWIKKLIGEGEVDAAATVVELMYERGLKPDAKHLNGIIGAWLRTRAPTSRNKAENMAWAMIHERIAFVRRRAGIASPESRGLVEVTRRLKAIPSFLRRLVPPANIETFSILLLHYTRRSEEQAAEQVTSMMTGPAQIVPNRFIMNHWMYEALRKTDLQRVWETYKTLTKETLRPDLETFACLWDTAKIQYDRSRVAHSSDFPSPRLLYAEMSGWLDTSYPLALKNARNDFSRDLYDQVIRCFSLSSDLKGTLSALHGLKQQFGEYPDADTTRMIVVQISRLLPADAKTPTSRRQVLRRRASLSRDQTAKVAEILETVADQKSAALMEKDIDPDKLGEAEVKDTQLQILSDFIIVILKRLEGGRDVKNNVATVAKVMGVDISSIDFDGIKEA